MPIPLIIAALAAAGGAAASKGKTKEITPTEASRVLRAQKGKKKKAKTQAKRKTRSK
ncbi:MAG TPA: hypothetical protein VK679_03160 [Gemmatimonadaceae bacterium]|nr:hypothetical protein [Gemmatimonadaceae bacterium]